MQRQPTLIILQTVAKQIKMHRKRSGITQQQLADKCDLFRTYLSRIEGATANPTITVLASLAFHLNVSVTELLVEPDNS